MTSLCLRADETAQAQPAKAPAAKPEFKPCGPTQQKVRIKFPQAVPLSSARHTYTPKYKAHTRKPMKNNNDKKFKTPLTAKPFRLCYENACSFLKIRHKGLLRHALRWDSRRSAMPFSGLRLAAFPPLNWGLRLPTWVSSKTQTSL